MKFVFNQKRNDEMRHMLMMQPKIEEAQEMVDKDETDPMAWYVMGKALSLEKRYAEAIEAHSRGIVYAPFWAPNYFGRGSKHNLKGDYWQALCDYSMAIQLDPSNWLYWYYRATTFSLNGEIRDAIDDFEECIKVSHESEHYPLIHWLFSSWCELGDFDKATSCLKLIRDDVVPPQMDYGYCRTVQLYKGLVKPEDFINEEEMAKVVLPRPGRVHLEENTMLYGLYWYWMVHGDEEKAKAALVRLKEKAWPGAFGYEKAKPFMEKFGI